jgi:hypothetical protein
VEKVPDPLYQSSRDQEIRRRLEILADATEGPSQCRD